jgi:hypothetical protein
MADAILTRGGRLCRTRLYRDSNTILISPHLPIAERIDALITAMLCVLRPCPELEILGSGPKLPVEDVA